MVSLHCTSSDRMINFMKFMVLKLYLVSCFCLIRLGEIMLQNTMKTSEWGLHILFISLLHLYIQQFSSSRCLFIFTISFSDENVYAFCILYKKKQPLSHKVNGSEHAWQRCMSTISFYSSHFFILAATNSRSCTNFLWIFMFFKFFCDFSFCVF